jgi:hypothetical protein
MPAGRDPQPLPEESATAAGRGGVSMVGSKTLYRSGIASQAPAVHVAASIGENQRRHSRAVSMTPTKAQTRLPRHTAFT